MSQRRPPTARPRAATPRQQAGRHTAAQLAELPPTLTVDEAGDMLGISRRSAYRAAARGEIPTLRLGRRLLVPTPRLLALLGLHLDGPADDPSHADASPLVGAARGWAADQSVPAQHQPPSQRAR